MICGLFNAKCFRITYQYSISVSLNEQNFETLIYLISLSRHLTNNRNTHYSFRLKILVPFLCRSRNEIWHKSSHVMKSLLSMWNYEVVWCQLLQLSPNTPCVVEHISIDVTPTSRHLSIYSSPYSAVLSFMTLVYPWFYAKLLFFAQVENHPIWQHERANQNLRMQVKSKLMYRRQFESVHFTRDLKEVYD